MARLIMLLLALSLTSYAHGQTSCNALERHACDEAIEKADAVIKGQDGLILKQQTRLGELQDQNDRFAKAVVELQKVSDQSLKNDLTWGIGGVMLGIITALLIKH